MLVFFFFFENQENGVEDSAKTTAGAKYYGFERRTLFSTEGSLWVVLRIPRISTANRTIFYRECLCRQAKRNHNGHGDFLSQVTQNFQKSNQT